MPREGSQGHFILEENGAFQVPDLHPNPGDSVPETGEGEQDTQCRAAGEAL